MTTTRPRAAGQAAGLNRQKILTAALEYIDQHGLEALSMHKLGAVLGVKGMSLYNHVANKDEVFDGVVELLWQEAEQAAPIQADWRAGYRSFARTLRDVMRGHPNAAPLHTSQQIMPEAALRSVQAHVTAAMKGGLPEEQAYALLRTVTTYALGSAAAAVSWGYGTPGCGPTVSDLLRPGTPEDLVGVADIFCGQSDLDAQFEMGLDLMLRGIDDAQPTS